MTNNKPRKRVLRSIPMHGIIYLVVGLVGCCSVKCYLLQTTSSLICLHFFGRRSVGHGKINQNHGNQFSEWKCYEGCEFCCCFFFLFSDGACNLVSLLQNINDWLACHSIRIFVGSPVVFQSFVSCICFFFVFFISCALCSACLVFFSFDDCYLFLALPRFVLFLDLD